MSISAASTAVRRATAVVESPPSAAARRSAMARLADALPQTVQEEEHGNVAAEVGKRVPRVFAAAVEEIVVDGAGGGEDGELHSLAIELLHLLAFAVGNARTMVKTPRLVDALVVDAKRFVKDPQSGFCRDVKSSCYAAQALSRDSDVAECMVRTPGYVGTMLRLLREPRSAEFQGLQIAALTSLVLPAARTNTHASIVAESGLVETLVGVLKQSPLSRSSDAVKERLSRCSRTFAGTRGTTRVCSLRLLWPTPCFAWWTHALFPATNRTALRCSPTLFARLIRPKSSQGWLP